MRITTRHLRAKHRCRPDPEFRHPPQTRTLAGTEAAMNDSAIVMCICGHSFSQATALTNHKRSCKSSKKRLSSALEKARQLWTGSKRRRLEVGVPQHKVDPPLPVGLVLDFQATPTELPQVRCNPTRNRNSSLIIAFARLCWAILPVPMR